MHTEYVGDQCIRNTPPRSPDQYICWPPHGVLCISDRSTRVTPLLAFTLTLTLTRCPLSVRPAWLSLILIFHPPPTAPLLLFYIRLIRRAFDCFGFSLFAGRSYFFLPSVIRFASLRIEGDSYFCSLVHHMISILFIIFSLWNTVKI